MPYAVRDTPIVWWEGRRGGPHAAVGRAYAARMVATTSPGENITCCYVNRRTIQPAITSAL